jgi:hypothetical protein
MSVFLLESEVTLVVETLFDLIAFLFRLSSQLYRPLHRSPVDPVVIHDTAHYLTRSGTP